ncbi:SMI1/KNR4 family protein [Herbidospora sp. NBRC 101105]|uniref:SMI1/KNR4 family protein n=1 Tax=Herbidospora sp. NBRC 101105 TaxID=3032195 RepID=UPI002556CAA2|nr:SMI1/KNR4 family protein [Herbidospora sp. NBRC 101105]
MRRLLTPRALILFSATVAATVAVVFFLRRPRPAPLVAPEPKEQTAAPWPPEPILGRPTEEDLARMRGEYVAPKPREPRRPLPRWAVAGIVLAVVAGLGQLFVYAVFDEPRIPAAPGHACAPPGCDAETVDEFTWSVLSEADPGLVYESVPDDGFEPPPPLVVGPDADCVPSRGTPVVAAPAKRTTRLVNRQWRRIEAWLGKNAPESRAALGTPARPRAIAEAEAVMGLRFPDDLKASLLRHDGGLGIMLDHLMPVARIAETWRSLCDIDDEDVADARDDWWDGRMIPIGEDGMGNHLIVDSVVGDVGDSDHEGTLTFEPGGVRIGSHLELLERSPTRWSGTNRSAGGGPGWSAASSAGNPRPSPCAGGRATPVPSSGPPSGRRAGG